MAEHNNSQELGDSNHSGLGDQKQASQQNTEQESLADNFRKTIKIIKHLQSLLSKNKNVMISNGLLALGTVGSEELYTWLAFHCPCAPHQNYLYGLMTIVLPVLLLFIFSIILNKKTWHVAANCQYREAKNTFLHLSSIIGKAAMAPAIWLIISLLHGEAYICAFSEFVDPTLFSAGEEKFPVVNATQILARFPCPMDPDLSVFRNKVRLKLLRESQLLGWLLISMVAILIFLIKCFKHCCSKFTQTYQDHYCASEEKFLRQTAKIHARVQAAKNVNSILGFVVLNEKDQKMRKDYMEKITKENSHCDTITFENLPNYSLLHKWIQEQKAKQSPSVMGMPMQPQCQKPKDECQTSNASEVWSREQCE